MISNFIKTRGLVIMSIALVTIIAVVVMVVNFSSSKKTNFELNQQEHQTSNDGLVTYSSSNVTSGGVTTGKKWSETVGSTTTLIAEPAEGYTFAYWTRTSATYKVSALDTVVTESSKASSFTPVFVANSRVKNIATLAEFTSNYNSSSYDILRLTANIDATGISYTPVITFTKVLDGAGYSILNLNVEISTQTTCGALVQTLNGGVIKNLTLNACKITDTTSPTATSLGGFAGTIRDGLISNCVMKSTVNSGKADCNVGGFVGKATGTSGTATANIGTSFIDHCVFAGAVLGAKVGALISDNDAAICDLQNNQSTGSMTKTS